MSASNSEQKILVNIAVLDKTTRLNGPDTKIGAVVRIGDNRIRKTTFRAGTKDKGLL